jgi:hypothetical protein
MEVEADIAEAKADKEIWHQIDTSEDEELAYDLTDDEFDKGIARDKNAANENL